MKNDYDSKKLTPKKIKTIGYLIICSLFVIAGISIIEEKALIGWIGIIFFGIGLILLLFQLLTNSSYLKIHETQIEIRTIYKSKFIHKKEITEFGIAKIPMIHIGHNYLNYNKKVVGFNFIESSSLNTELSNFNKEISHYQDILPDNYGYKPEKLVEILNDWLTSSYNKS